MNITFWGVRGSLPSPLVAENVKEKIFKALTGATPDIISNEESIKRYVDSLPLSVGGTVGGNTSCVEVRHGNTEIIIDAGSGIRNLSERLLMGDFGKGKGVGHVLISHFHWDHIQGFPFFVPFYLHGNRFYIYSPRPEFSDILFRQQNPDNFPAALQNFPASIEFVTLDGRNELRIDDIRISWIKLNHPGDSYAYRLQGPDGCLVYATDSEYECLSDDEVEKYIRFFEGCDLLIFDSMYTVSAALERQGWGHSTAYTGARFALEAGAKRLALYHHEPSYDDAKLERIHEEVRKYVDEHKPGAVEILIAYEGLSVSI